MNTRKNSSQSEAEQDMEKKKKKKEAQETSFPLRSQDCHVIGRYPESADDDITPLWPITTNSSVLVVVVMATHPTKEGALSLAASVS